MLELYLRQSFEQNVAVGMQQDFVRVSSKIILTLRHAVRNRDDIFAGLLEAVDRRADFAQARKTDAGDFVGNRHREL